MNRSKAYENFFVKTEAGQEFLKTIATIISQAHEDAEREPEHARDYTQQAKGVRNIEQHIRSVLSDVKKGRK